MVEHCKAHHCRQEGACQQAQGEQPRAFDPGDPHCVHKDVWTLTFPFLPGTFEDQEGTAKGMVREISLHDVCTA